MKIVALRRIGIALLAAGVWLAITSCRDARDPALDRGARLIDQAAATGDPDELDRIYRALAEILRADLPLTRLVPATLTTFVHRRVRGLSTPFRAKPDKYMEDLWLEARGSK